MNNYLLKPLTAAVMATALTGCLSSGSSSDGTGSMSLDITDAPVDSLQEVNITITGVTLKPQNGPQRRIDLINEEGEIESKTINLLDFSRGKTEPLFEDLEVTAGNYNFILLHLDTGQLNVVDDGGNTHTLSVPSGAQQGLRLVSGFTIPQGGSADFTVDFDVRKSIVNPSNDNDYKLRPALRLLDNTQVGSVEGNVFQEVWNEQCAEVTEFAGVVYVYEGHDVTPVDINIDRDKDEVQPLVAGNVEMPDGDDEYNYKVAFLSEGNYTIAYTCDVDDIEADNELDFVGTRNITIVASETQVENFPEDQE